MRQKRLSIILGPIVFILACIATVVFCEMAARFLILGFSSEVFLLQNFTPETQFLNFQSRLGQIDPTLGWIPTPGYARSEGTGYTPQVTILDDSTRSNGDRSAQPNSPQILAVGDSFTFGDQVSDRDSWPAQLQGLTKLKVINGGVFSYGIDQTVMRAKILIERSKPSLLVMSVIADDVRRTRQSVRSGLPKPYYTVENGVLKLHPIPSNLSEELLRNAIRRRDHQQVRNLLGYSYLAKHILSRLFPYYWFADLPPVEIDNDPNEVSCLLIRDLDNYLFERNIPGILLVQYTRTLVPERPTNQRLFGCLRPQLRMRIIDLYPVLEALKLASPDEYKRLFDDHMTPRGNELVANTLAPEIKSALKLKRKLSPPIAAASVTGAARPNVSASVTTEDREPQAAESNISGDLGRW
jgi:hypothetical protein